MRNGHTVLFAPDWRTGNPYMERLSAGLRREGYAVFFANFPDGYLKLNRLASAYSSVGIIHLHWLSAEFLDQLYWSKNRVKFGLRLLLLSIDVLLCRARGIRIFWTLHNLIEHESRDSAQELLVRSLLARLVNGVIAHSEAALNLAAKAYHVNLTRYGHVIPHGNYIGAYEYSDEIKQSLRKKYEIGADHTVLLFFGAVRRYKGLDQLIPVFHKLNDEQLRLIIVGRSFDEKIAQWLAAEAVTDARIRLSLGFVPEAQVAAHFALASAVILPLQSSLTSGSVILAMSLGKCLILPDSTRVLGVPGDAGALYYNNAVALETLLRDLHKFDTAEMGANNLIRARQLDWNAIATTTATVYAGN